MLRNLIIATVLFVGNQMFAQQAEAPTSSADQMATASPTVKTNDSTTQFAYVHVYRQRRYAGSALAPTISIDDVKVARVGNGRCFTAKLSAGSHVIHSDDKSSAISIDAKAGQDYYIRVDEETGMWKGHGKLTMLMPEQGKPEYQLQKPVETDRRFAKEMLEVETEGQNATAQ